MTSAGKDRSEAAGKDLYNKNETKIVIQFTAHTIYVTWAGVGHLLGLHYQLKGKNYVAFPPMLLPLMELFFELFNTIQAEIDALL